jgi:hypothetical protein
VVSLKEIARTLGRRGGLRRAQRLSPTRRAEIARMGADARAESFRLAAAIRNNFEYVQAIDQLRPPRPVVPESACRGPLPGSHGEESSR